MKESSQRISLLVLATSFVLGWLLYYAHLFPYYFSYDMDIINAEDFLLIGSGQLPDHLIHPGVGLLFLLKIFSWVSYPLGLLAAHSIEDLQKAVIPVLVLAQTTEWVRIISPIMIFLIAALSSSALARLYKMSIELRALVFLLFGFAFFVPLNDLISRSELFAVFYLVLSWWAAVQSVYELRRWLATTYLVLSGVALGLSFITKIQGVVLVVATVLWVGQLILQHKNPASPKENPGPANSAWLARLNIILFLTLSVLAWVIRIPDNILHSRSSFGLTPWWALFLIALLSCGAGLQVKSRLISSQAKAMLAQLNFLFFGFIMSFASHFVIRPGFIKGLQYALITFKVVYFGRIVANITQDVHSDSLMINFIDFSAVFCAYFAVTLLLVYHTIKTGARRNVLIVSLTWATWLLVFANLYLALRTLISKDLIWFEVPVLFFGLYFAYGLFADPQIQKSMGPKREYFGRGVIAIALLLYVIAGADYFRQNFQRFQPSYLRESSFYDSVYGGNQVVIKHIMNAAFDEGVDRSKLSIHVQSPGDELRDWKLALSGPTADLKNIGYVERGLAVSNGFRDLRIVEAAPEWQSASTYDLTDAKESSSSIVLPFRPNFKLALFVEEAEFESVCMALRRASSDVNCQLGKATFIALISKSNPKRVRFSPVMFFENTETSRIDKTIRIDRGQLKGRYFLAQYRYPR